jgi:Co/Zn/Cd efflux system component
LKQCCDDQADALGRLRGRQSRVLVAVLAINATMFVIEAVAGSLSRSSALLGDSLDMLADALVYGVTIYALDRGARWRARASVLKGMLMLALGVAVVVEAFAKAISQVVPDAEAIGGIGLVALGANVGCLLLLRAHREDDINMRSSWICSRNDIIANLAVLAAAMGVRAFESWWPDVIVGCGIAMLFIVSAIAVLRTALEQLGETAGRKAGDAAGG